VIALKGSTATLSANLANGRCRARS
jgi:hypothetical protein